MGSLYDWQRECMPSSQFPFMPTDRFSPFYIDSVDRDGRRIKLYLSNDQLYECFIEYIRRHPEEIQKRENCYKVDDEKNVVERKSKTTLKLLL